MLTVQVAASAGVRKLRGYWVSTREASSRVQYYYYRIDQASGQIKYSLDYTGLELSRDIAALGKVFLTHKKDREGAERGSAHKYIATSPGKLACAVRGTAQNHGRAWRTYHYVRQFD